MTDTTLEEVMERLEYYELRKVEIPGPKDGEMVFATAAILSCGLCGCVIDGMGGPGSGQVCVPCGNLVKSGRACGAVKWEHEAKVDV